MYAELALENTVVKACSLESCKIGSKAGGSGGDGYLPPPVKGQGLQDVGLSRTALYRPRMGRLERGRKVIDAINVIVAKRS